MNVLSYLCSPILVAVTFSCPQNTYMNTKVKHVPTWIFGLLGIWYLYKSLEALTMGMPITSCMTIAMAALVSLASYFSWMRRWGIVVVLMFVFMAISDVAAVYYAANR